MHRKPCFSQTNGPFIARNVIRTAAVHRPFYISICISTLPTQDTTFIIKLCKHRFRFRNIVLSFLSRSPHYLCSSEVWLSHCRELSSRKNILPPNSVLVFSGHRDLARYKLETVNRLANSRNRNLCHMIYDGDSISNSLSFAFC